MASQMTVFDLKIDVVSDAADLLAGYDVLVRTFGEQTRDAIFHGTNPGWDAPTGKQKNAENFAARFARTTTNRAGQPNTVFLKASLTDTATRERVVAGVAIWVQASVVPGWGDVPPEDEGAAIDVAALYPDDPAKQKLWGDVLTGFHARRRQLTKDKAEDLLPALMALDLCAVDPRFQGRGIAKRLVQWGLDEAERRGGMEAVTEASVMGRRVYLKMGFEQEGNELDYGLNQALLGVSLPSNVFLRTKKP